MPFNPSPSAVHVDALMTQISIATMQNPANFVAGRVFPSIGVQKQSDKYASYPKGAFLRSNMKKRAPGTQAAVASYTVETNNTYFADTWALAHLIPDERRANEDAPFNADRDATMFLSRQALLMREIEWAATYFKAGVWGLDRTGVAGSPGANEFKQFNDASSTPIRVIRQYQTEFALNAAGYRPNKMTMGRLVYDTLLDHPEIVDRVKYGQTAGGPARPTRSILAELFEIDEILVMDAVQNTAIEGAADSYSFIGNSKGILLSYSPAAPSQLEPSAGYTFAWQGFLPGQGPTLGETISRFRDERARTDIMQIDNAFDMKLVSQDMGMFLASAIA